MLKFNGTQEFGVPIVQAYAKLSDARFLTSCIPGVEAVARQEPTQAVLNLRPGFSFVRGTLEVTIEIHDLKPQESLRYRVLSKGIGSSSEVEALGTLEPAEGKTRFHWIVEVKNLGGLLKAIPVGLIQASAHRVIGDALRVVDQKLRESR